jgi:hypothetical protein
MAARVTTRGGPVSRIEPMSTIELASAPEGAARRQPGWRQPARLPVLFLIADTGGGHRSAARAVGQALDRLYPGRFGPVLCDPLGGPGSARLLRWVTGLYGPAIRLAPWLWGAAYHATDSGAAAAVLRRTLLRLADRPALAAARTHRRPPWCRFTRSPAPRRSRPGTMPHRIRRP